MGDTDKVIACFKALSFKPDIGEFEHRIIAQKTVYLLQLKGMKTGFSYGLYARGPYSPALTDELYNRKQDFEQLKTSVTLSQREIQAVQELKELFGLKASLLEVAATYSFFISREALSPIEAIGRLKKLKPFFSEAQVAVGISRAKEFLFKPTEKDLEKMKSETAAWQSASIQSIERDKNA